MWSSLTAVSVCFSLHLVLAWKPLAHQTCQMTRTFILQCKHVSTKIHRFLLRVKTLFVTNSERNHLVIVSTKENKSTLMPVIKLFTNCKLKLRQLKINRQQTGEVFYQTKVSFIQVSFKLSAQWQLHFLIAKNHRLMPHIYHDSPFSANGRHVYRYIKPNRAYLYWSDTKLELKPKVNDTADTEENHKRKRYKTSKTPTECWALKSGASFKRIQVQISLFKVCFGHGDIGY